MTYKDKASYGVSPLCRLAIMHFYTDARGYTYVYQVVVGVEEGREQQVEEAAGVGQKQVRLV
jgi:hypothetical protein